MRPDPRTRRGSFLVSLGSHLLGVLIGLLRRTWRLRVVSGGERLERVLEAGEPVVLTFWHNRSFAAAHLLLARLLPAGFSVTLLSSQSRDGELVARLARRWGLSVVRGSASRGGREALTGTYRAIVRHRSSPVMIPDGPRGPAYGFKVGVLVLAQMSRAPILPLGFAASSFWTVGSWDRLIVPKPFAKVAVVVGEPETVPRELPAPELEAARRRWEERLNDLTRRAEEAVGAEDPLRGARSAGDRD